MSADDAGFERLLEYLKRNRGFDFGGYKKPGLMRRVERRMQALGVRGFDAYLDHLEVHPGEFAELFDSILINVTSFFRDEAAWQHLAAEVLPAIGAAKAAGEPVRVWSAGCASGEEAYSIAMLLAEALGAEAFAEHVKIYATDLDDEALARARASAYSAREVESVPPELRSRYFQQQGARYVFRGDLRRAVIFGRHDMMSDAPIGGLDLILCRNALMYFNADVQGRILQRFHFALHDGGYLFLGKAEMLLTRGALFQPIDLKSRIFLKVAQPGETRRRLAVAPPPPAGPAKREDRLLDVSGEEAPVARIVVDENGVLALANQRARVLFKLDTGDVGRLLQDLEISYRPAELRSLIEKAYAEHRPIAQTNVERRLEDGSAQVLDILVAPVFDDKGAALGVSITFLDVSYVQELKDELRRSREDLQTTNEELQSSNEELETTNEELQSSNEELETTNEELQSTNEELETMNEELQSTNEELQTLNEQLRQRTDEAGRLSAFLESVLAGLGAGAAVLDANYNVLVWNHRAEDLWGMRADEVRGKSFLALDIGLPVGELRPLIRAGLAGDDAPTELTLPAVNRRGKHIQCRVGCTPLVSALGKRDGVILMMVEVG
ncbi:MAG TPA: CheR family methyltransferase [Burkholderiales bacterium]|jgi:two-component system CheB/CheR fusion protein